MTKEKDSIIYEDVKFESYCALVTNTQLEYPHFVTLHYDGNEICGRLGIAFSKYGETNKKNAYLKFASEIIELFH